MNELVKDILDAQSAVKFGLEVALPSRWVQAAVKAVMSDVLEELTEATTSDIRALGRRVFVDPRPSTIDRRAHIYGTATDLVLLCA
jgi:hypothetical protein